MLKPHRISRTSAFLLGTLLTMFLTPAEPVWAKGPRCENVLLGIPTHESSVEIEIGANPSWLKSLFTSTDGTIRPLTANMGLSGVPQEIQARLRRAHPNSNDILSLPFEALSPEEAMSIIMQTAKVSQQSYSETRTLPGLKYLERIELVFPKGGAWFLGKFYGRGKNTLRSEDVFGSTAIEFMGDNRMQQNLGFELHLRSDHRPSENFRSARTLQIALQGSIGHLHEHVVAVLDETRLRTDLHRYSLQIAEYSARLGFFVALLRALKHKKFSTIENESGQSINFLSGNAYSFEGIDQFIQGEIDLLTRRARRQGKSFEEVELTPEHAFKLRGRGFIGVAMGKKYDGDGFKVGIEFRDLAPSLPENLHATLLDSTQIRLSKSDFGVDGDLVKSMRSRSHPAPLQLYFPGKNDASSAVVDLLRRLIPPSEHGRYAGLVGRFNSDLSGNELLGILLKRYDRDPLFVADPPVLARVEEIQRQALRMINNAAAPEEVLFWFIKKSGIFHHVGQSLIYDYDKALLGDLAGQVNLRHRDR